MRVTAWFVIMLAAVGAFAERLEAQTENTPPTFAINIVAPPIVKLGSEITVSIVLQNKSGRTVKMYYNEMARDDDYIVTVLDEARKRPPLTWTGRNVIDHNPGVRVDSVHFPNHDIADGEVITQKLEIGKFFVLSEPGKYTVQFSRGEGKTAAKSNTVTIMVIP